MSKFYIGMTLNFFLSTSLFGNTEKYWLTHQSVGWDSSTFYGDISREEALKYTEAHYRENRLKVLTVIYNDSGEISEIIDPFPNTTDEEATND